METKYTVIARDLSELEALLQVMEKEGSYFLEAFDDNGGLPDGNAFLPSVALDFGDEGINSAIEQGIGKIVLAEFWDPIEWAEDAPFDDAHEFIKENVANPYWSLYAHVLVVSNG